MNTDMPRTVSLTSSWFIRPGCEPDVRAAVQQLAARVQAEEPDTLTYLVHAPRLDDARLQSLPPQGLLSLLFFEVYRDADAFLRHLNGVVFADFVGQHGHLFVSSNGQPFTTVQFLSLQAGFSRLQLPAAVTAVGHAGASLPANRHPAVMFEIIGRDQGVLKTFYSRVFGWKFRGGSGGFAYVDFLLHDLPLLGGIGQADPSVPGFEPGHSFYLLVEDLQAAVERALAGGGRCHVDPTDVDGYRFAMILDPEGNAIGLVEPFGAMPGGASTAAPAP